MKTAVLFLLFNACVWAAQTTALFDSTQPAVGPFPSDALAILDPAQKTDLRVNLPASFEICDPASSPSVCADQTTIGLINQLDGFSLNPRLMACFSGPIDPATLRAGIQILPVVPLLGPGAPVSINQILFDPARNCAFAKPNQVLNQQSHYLLIVTDSVHDTSGHKVQQSPAFAACLASSDIYCEALETAFGLIHPPFANIVTASLFTTMSATTWLQQARALVNSKELPANRPLRVFNLSSVRQLTWVPQGSGDDAGNSEIITPDTLAGVGQIAFGTVMSPLFLDPASGAIPQTPTRRPLRLPAISVPVSYHVFLPAAPAPSDGYPVAIYGHGLGDNQFGAPTYIASTLAQAGIATLAFEITGHGYGPGGVVNVTTSTGVQTVPTPGRGILIPGNQTIGESDGCIVPGAIAVRDCARQTAVDLFALVRAIDTPGLRGLRLNTARVYYIGQSFGGTYGTLLHAVEPNEKAAVLNGAGGTSVDVARLAITGRPLGIEYLGSVNPCLLNANGGKDFDDNYVFRDMPPVVKHVPGAMAIQAAFEAAEWLGLPGDPLSFAPHLKTGPLPGVPPKSTLFQFGYGDLEVPNPTESAVVRAANAKSNTSFFRFDKAAAIDLNLLAISMPGLAPLPILPHRILSNPTVPEFLDEAAISIAEQRQAAVYFKSNGALIVDPDLCLTGEFAGSNLFETPPTALPTQLNYFQFGPTP